ncbi:hypothetical protein PENVUL_c004G08176 [Penicillium vulpinum]|uniref:DUF7600 domain-containing protein n=1 Tax=Penicillium vulpinum TaxID=29845 RepID=A0A1V6S829_9EURO|nr:hypothetical protein PENVUL_c004G08176 [Penicillium vulpinum]
MSMAPNVYCPLCGVVLLPDPYSNDYGEEPAWQSHARPWYAEVRGLYSTDVTTGNVTTTGLGIVRGRNILCAPLRSDQSYAGAEPMALGEWRLFGSSVVRWCFGFHDSCWKLLLLRLAHGSDEASLSEADVAESVFYQLYCTPCIDGSIFQFGHDYDGAAQTHKSFGQPNAVNLRSHLYADPCAIPSLKELERTASDFRKICGSWLWKDRDGAYPTTAAAADTDCHSKEGTSASGSFGPSGNCHLVPPPDIITKQVRENAERPKHYIFDGLPLELRHEILSYLSFDEILGLRLDWYTLFFGTRASLMLGMPSLVNRKRIRHLLEPVVSLVGLEAILRKGPCGSAIHPAQIEGGYYQLIDGQSAETPSGLIEIAGFFSGQIASIGANRPLDKGCRVLYHRKQSFISPLWQCQQRIGISTIQFGTQSFISGITLFPSEEHDIVDSQVGYHNPASEIWIDIPDAFHVKALGVAFCSEGLTGIKLIYTDSSSSGWVGSPDGPGIARGTLSIPERPNQCCLLVGLDRYKIVSLGFGEMANHLETLKSSHSQSVRDSSRVQSYLWMPHPPRHDDLSISILLPSASPRAFEPLTNIDFGGQRGLLLASLTRLTFHMASDPYLFIGIEVSYSDGRSVLFGSNGGCGISFFIDGPKGERINRIGMLPNIRRPTIRRPEIRGSDPEGSIGGLQVSTNYGRTATFAHLRYRLNAAVEFIPISPPGNTITGLVAVEMVSPTRFKRIGIQSQECGKQPEIPDILDYECHQIPDDELRYDEKFSRFINSTNPGNYHTYASLKNIRRIQASTGIYGRSRSSNCISGLKFEYYNHPSPGIVGQWMHELNDGFELSEDEDIQSLTIWLVPTGFSTECQGIEVGQVAAIHIETTCSRSVTFRPPDFQSIPSQTLQHHQYQGDFDEKLTAISWILNLSCERVRAVISRNTSRRTSQILVPEQETPFDQVRKLYFERQNDDGCRDTIITAEAYFKDRAIVGLVFIYASGHTASTGDLHTKTRQTVHFAPDAQIVRLSAVVANTDHKLLEIEFEVGRNEQHRYEKLGLPANISHDLGHIVSCYWRETQCKDDASAEDYQRFSVSERVYKPPNGSRLVGIYMCCQEFSRVGALYELGVSP